eukprot:TRINITY_DN1530_c0_g1_i1.p1 TRINITY_DN1530_c0_g1~~TRINITY_DN1530_c0_g1_i1.p1  ORF type:complete len:352 (-),score=21.18 TRINITY_DN1530_c0_g1_i1:402-1457(-)
MAKEIGKGKGTSEMKNSFFGKGTSARMIGSIFMWYFFSSLTNNVAKTILQYPTSSSTTLALVHVGAISLYSRILLSYSKKYSYVPFKRSDFSSMFILTLTHIVAMVLSNISLDKVPVSFAHTIKSASPIASVVISRVMLGKRSSVAQVLSIIPIIFGVTMCTITEIHFHIVGFICALTATILFSFKNIFSKRILLKAREEDTRDKFNYLNVMYHISLMSFCALAPFWFFRDGIQILLHGMMFPLILLHVLISWCYFGTAFFAFSVLAEISPVSYSVANTFKRVFVIVTSVLWFGNPLPPASMVGIAIAIAGIYMYNRAGAKKRALSSRSLAIESDEESAEESKRRQVEMRV